jgi:hypothetical protein
MIYKCLRIPPFSLANLFLSKWLSQANLFIKFMLDPPTFYVDYSYPALGKH